MVSITFLDLYFILRLRILLLNNDVEKRIRTICPVATIGVW